MHGKLKFIDRNGVEHELQINGGAFAIDRRLITSTELRTPLWTATLDFETLVESIVAKLYSK